MPVCLVLWGVLAQAWAEGAYSQPPYSNNGWAETGAGSWSVYSGVVGSHEAVVVVAGVGWMERVLRAPCRSREVVARSAKARVSTMMASAVAAEENVDQQADEAIASVGERKSWARGDRSVRFEEHVRPAGHF